MCLARSSGLNLRFLLPTIDEPYRILLHAFRIGSPPARDDAPPEHQAELAAMDR